MGGMRKVDDHAQPVHLSYHSFSKLSEATMLRCDTGLVHMRAVCPGGVARVGKGQRHSAQSGRK